MTVADFIRLIPDATTVELTAALCDIDPEQDSTARAGMADLAIRELIRRERERCATVCDDAQKAMAGSPTAEAVAEMLADKIRGLQ